MFVLSPTGEANNLFDVFITDDLTVLQASGLGGTSLINANVALDMDPAVFKDSAWPKQLQNDVGQLMSVDRKHFFDMIKPATYPDHYPHLHKIDRMKEALGGFDIEDLDKILVKVPLFVTFEDKLRNHVGMPQPKCTACGNCVGGCNVGAKNTLNMNYLPDAKAHGAEIFTEVWARTFCLTDNERGFSQNTMPIKGSKTNTFGRNESAFLTAFEFPNHERSTEIIVNHIFRN